MFITMNNLRHYLALILSLWLVHGASAQLPALNLDAWFDWKDPLNLTQAMAESVLVPNRDLGEPWFSRKALDGGRTMIEMPAMELRGKRAMSWGPRGLPVLSGTLFFGPEGVTSIIVQFGRESRDPEFAKNMVAELNQLAGGAPPEFYLRSIKSSDKPMQIIRWNRDTYRIEASRRDETDFWRLAIFRGVLLPGRMLGETLVNPAGIPMAPGAPAAPATPTPPVVVMSRPEKVKLAADLDPLLGGSSFWKTTAEEFEALYVPRVEQQQKPPQFEWLTTTKERARFSRQMFSDTATTLTLFGGSMTVEEAIVEFVNGRAARATISFYNRGDSGQMGAAEFEVLFKMVWQSLGQSFNVTPRRQMSAGSGAVKNVAWMWSSPQAVALLEHNDFQGGATLGKPEFMRLKLASLDQADWTMGKMSMGVQRMALQNNVSRDPSGDVFISGVPMVDQGAKGYCVAASCQRLFEYMRIPCDQHEMAQILSVDVERGANAIAMQKSLAKIDQKFGVTFKPLVNPEVYYSSNGKRRVSIKEFASIIKEHADKGVPLLWGLTIGKFAEEPPLPSGGQMSGGHMRMIIGYNSAKSQVIFTDSWGAGHEKKRMSAADAYEVTMGLYSMSPRGM